MKSPSFKARVRGYEAMTREIDHLLALATKRVPKTCRAVDEKSASYRMGVYRGLLTAHCLATYGESPTHNQQRINEILNENQEPTR